MLLLDGEAQERFRLVARAGNHAPRRRALLAGVLVERVLDVGPRGAMFFLAFFENAFFENAFFENTFFENFANFWRARSRLYQYEILQEAMRLTAFSSSTRCAHVCAAPNSEF